jgi:DNA-binding response OmpR family regulator
MDTTPHITTATTGPRIVVIEDERTLAEAIALRLRADGFEVDVALNGADGLVACDPLPALVILDWMLPDTDGLAVCRQLRARGDVPVLLLTARTTEADVVAALTAGADDHVAKPVGMRELVARVRAMLRLVARTTKADAPATLAVGDVQIAVSTRRVHRAGSEVHLTSTELDLLLRIAERQGDVVTRATLLREVWELPEGVPSRTLDTHVAVLRRKLGADVVRTVHGVGYAAGAA